MKIQRGDMVIVVAGNDSADTPRKVIQVLDGGHKVVVEGVNRVFKHVRRGHPKSPQGGRLSLEKPIDASNVKLQCTACGKATRVGFRYTDEGSKERFCKKCQAAQGTISPPRAQYAKKS